MGTLSAILTYELGKHVGLQHKALSRLPVLMNPREPSQIPQVRLAQSKATLFFLIEKNW